MRALAAPVLSPLALGLLAQPAPAQACGLEDALGHPTFSIGHDVAFAADLVGNRHVFSTSPGAVVPSDPVLFAESGGAFGPALPWTGAPPNARAVAADEGRWAATDEGLGQLVCGTFAAGTTAVRSTLSDAALVSAEAALDMDGGWLVVGQPNHGGAAGRVRVYSVDAAGVPTFVEDVTAFNAAAGDRFGAAVSVYSGPERDVLLVGAPNKDAFGQTEGSIYFYVWDAGSQTWDLTNWWLVSFPDGRYGAAVAVYGDLALAGAPQADFLATDDGYVNWYFWDGTGYSPGLGFVAESGDRLGSEIALEGDLALVGAPGDDGPADDQPDVGGAMVLRWNGAEFEQELAMLNAPAGVAGDLYGSVMDVHDGTVALGSPNGTSFSAGEHPIRLYGLGTSGTLSPASETVRLGAPANPNAFLPGQTSGPVLGATWDPVIDHTAFVPGAISDFVLITGGPLELPLGPQGTLLCNVAAPPLILVGAPAPGAPFAIPVPANCPLVGVTLCSQGGSIDGAFATHLANAIDITLGTY